MQEENKKTYALFHCHSTRSMMDGYGSIKNNVKRAKELGLHTLGISDHGTISGCVELMKTAQKEKIRYALGCELYISRLSACIRSNENRSLEHMVCFARNKKGWQKLVQLTNQTNEPDCFYYKPRISLENFTNEDGKFYPGVEYYADGSIIFINGHQGTRLSNILWYDPEDPIEKQKKDLSRAYAQYKGIKNPDYYKAFLHKNWLENTCKEALRLEKLLGKGSFFIELQNELSPKDKTPLWVHPIIVDCLRQVAKETGIPTIASSDPHYPYPEDSTYQRILVMTNLKETESSVKAKIEDVDNLDTMIFFGSDNFYIHSYDEMAKNFSKDELENTVKLAEQVEQYSVLEKPYIPKFAIPEFPDKEAYLSRYTNKSDKYLMYLCVEGAKKIQPWLTNKNHDKDTYWERLRYETDIIFGIGLSDYFLVVHDVCMAADFRPADRSFDWQKNLKEGGKTDPVPRGVGRGSAAGCLISYLTNITGIDPVRYDLLFSRFFNAGRMSSDNISLPDIDIDFAVEDRDWIIDYVRWKYGSNKVAQILTHLTIKGKAAIKDVFRAKDVENHFEIANEISQYIEDESVIADAIQEMKESGDDSYNILRWCIDNSEEFRKYYDDPKYKEFIDIAIKCEGVTRGSGRHPSGIVIGNDDLNEKFPMTYDTKSKQKIVGIDLKSAESLGLCKFDFLGVAVLSKLKFAQDLINKRKV